MNDNIQAWHEDENDPVHTMENEDQPPEENLVNAEEKTETWKTSFPAGSGQVNIENPEMLLNSEEIHDFRSRWNDIQAKFVDEPGASVRQADALVAEVMGQVTQVLANQRRTLEGQWNLGATSQGDASPREASTEDLRQILQSYRAFFNRLLK
jgi:hypothetical protein